MRHGLKDSLEGEVGLGWVHALFSPRMYSAVAEHAKSKDEAVSETLRGYLRLTRAIEIEASRAQTLSQDATIRVEEIEINMERLLSDYNFPNMQRKMISFAISEREHLQMLIRANLAQKNISQYLRESVALGLEVDRVMKELGYSSGEGYPISVGNKSMLFVDWG